MITLIILIYIILSLIVSFGRMQDRFTLSGELIKGDKPQKAFKEGFLIPIILATGLAVFIGGIMLVGVAIIGVFCGGVWIFHNLP
jgi:hypothetical protein